MSAIELVYSIDNGIEVNPTGNNGLDTAPCRVVFGLIFCALVAERETDVFELRGFARIDTLFDNGWRT